MITITSLEAVQRTVASTTSPNGCKFPLDDGRFVELRANFYWHVTNAKGRIVSGRFATRNEALRSVGIEVVPC